MCQTAEFLHHFSLEKTDEVEEDSLLGILSGPHAEVRILIF